MINITMDDRDKMDRRQVREMSLVLAMLPVLSLLAALLIKWFLF